MVISDLVGLDTERAMKMTILHDLGESIIGDMMPDKIYPVERKFLKRRPYYQFVETSSPITSRL
jgi:putative hydrolase of HD superfamily